jgi:hypothetical protein
MQLCLLLASELPFRYDNFDILKDNREASNPVKLNSQYRLTICLDSSLIGNVSELARSIDKFLPNLACKLVNSDKVAYAEAKAHGDFSHSTLVAVYRKKVLERKRSRRIKAVLSP